MNRLSVYPSGMDRQTMMLGTFEQMQEEKLVQAQYEADYWRIMYDHNMLALIEPYRVDERPSIFSDTPKTPKKAPLTVRSFWG